MTDEQPLSARDLLLKLTVNEMRQKIRALSPKPDMEVGIRFLEKILDDKGVAGVVDVVERGSQVIDKDGRFYSYDFEEGGSLQDFCDAYKSATPNLMTRRNFLRIATWGIGGPVLVANQVTKQGGKVWTAVNKKLDVPSPQDNPLQNSYQFIQEKGIYDFGELMIGLGITAEAVNIWFDTKLENIANAICEIDKPRENDKISR